MHIKCALGKVGINCGTLLFEMAPMVARCLLNPSSQHFFQIELKVTRKSFLLLRATLRIFKQVFSSAFSAEHMQTIMQSVLICLF
jgi:hypothetical protein